MIRSKQLNLPVSLYLLTVLLAGCLTDVPRDNPLDPLAENFEPTAHFEGLITDRTEVGLGGVQIQLGSQGSDEALIEQTTTDPNGRFRLSGLPIGDYRITLSRTGFETYSDTVQVLLNQTDGYEARLNGLPEITDYQIVAGRISRRFPQPFDFYQLEVKATATDYDGLIDIAYVAFEIEGLPDQDTMRYDPATEVYRATVQEQNLSTGSLESILGRRIYLNMEDKMKAKSQTPGDFIVRLIYDVPAAVSPQAGSIVREAQPVLEWSCLTLPFPFVYRLEVFHSDNGVTTSVDLMDDLDPNNFCQENQTASYQVSSSLPEGAYFWTVSVVDAFGNYSRSREAGFLIDL